MAIEVFNRHENKYILDTKTFTSVQSRLTDYMELDAYNKEHEYYTITNLYYDTADSHLIRTSIQKPKYKEKLRLRRYGMHNGDAKVYLEIKKKVAGFVNKRRSAIKLDEAYRFLQTGSLPEPEIYMNMQVLREVEYILAQHQLKPAVYLAYDRRAWFSQDKHDLRISFDCNIRTRHTDLRLESEDWGERLLGKEQCIMEIKVERSIPIWLSRLLAEYKIYPTSFSKYGTEYIRALTRQTKEQNTFVMIPVAENPLGVSIPACS